MRFLLVVGLGVVLVMFIAVVSYATAPEPPRTHSVYFEANKLSDNEFADAAADAWYSSTLEAMKEPSLFHPPASKGPDETYRALVSYGRDYLMSIRLERSTSGASVVANEIDYRPNGKNRTARRALSQSEWSTLTRAISDTDFWNDNSLRGHYTGHCLDYVIEARQGTRYHMVSMSCPKDPAFQRLGEVFPDLAGWFPY
jgi:hypothetical protein